ncbi:MAG: mevalonate kinase [Candidatus Nitrosotenuis sp.]|uniref:Mevalonate kinase n=1 Tax=Candidatus Nitrosotenuis uzonensis TaxID=1407055 RepID=A0A812EWD3_9ARCH|nr:mevalonate kinase [Candidatus Nitrosotenuis uzonensis]CAE6493824.1 Mevalonate kinase [Candidatus Nitrosotenuis uzonensis]
MKSVSSAPGKIILFGEHFIVYGGKAILCAIDRRITVESELMDNGKIEITSSVGNALLSTSDQVSSVEPSLRPIVHLAKKILAEYNSTSGIRIGISAEFPAGVGLGSSSACCVAAASSILGLFADQTRDRVLELALEAERTVFESTSGADTTVCTLGGAIEYHRDGYAAKLDFEPNFTLIVADSQISHSTSSVVSRVRKYKDNNPAIFSLLCTQEERLIEDALEALKNGDLRVVGQRMSQNQKYLEQIGVSNDKLNVMVDLAKSTSYGAKITGAGDGGCIIALVDQSNIESTMKVLCESGHQCFGVKVDMLGLQHKLELT